MMDTNSTIYIENFPLTTKPKILHDVFSCFGHIIAIKLPTFPPGHPLNIDPNYPSCKGFAFIQFASQSDAQKACDFFHNLNNIFHLYKKDKEQRISYSMLFKITSDSIDHHSILLCRVMSKRAFLELEKDYENTKFKSLTGVAKMLSLS